MLINQSNLNNLFLGFSTAFNGAFTGAPTTYKEIAMIAHSTGSDEKYAWLGSFAKLREWVGDRVVRNLELHDYTIKNRKFEDTIKVSREDIEDDKVGVLAPMFSEMGRSAAVHPDQLVYELMALGFATICYDGQNFFDDDHPLAIDGGEEISVSNMQAGSAPAWYLIDASRMVKPFIWQERVGYKFTALTRDEDPNVFMQDDYLYGLRARVNAGFGLWQLAFASKAALSKENYEAARQAMTSLKGNNGKPLGVAPTHLVVPTTLEGDARRLIINQVGEAGASNEWAGSAKLIVTPYLATE